MTLAMPAALYLCLRDNLWIPSEHLIATTRTDDQEQQQGWPQSLLKDQKPQSR
jgi:hypothetical protein